MEKAGHHWHMRTVGDVDCMTSMIEMHAALESSGWKGREGTALDGSDAQSRFYIELLRTFAAEDQATVYQLLFDDRNVSIVENYTNASDEDRRWCTSAREIVDWDYFPLNIIRSLVETRRRLRARGAED